MLFYRSALPLSPRTLNLAAHTIRAHRARTGSRWRRLDPGQQALLVLVHLHRGEPFAQVAAGFGVGTVTAWQYVRETTALPSPGARLQFGATAYCKGSTTASGVAVRSGVAAADPDLLPVGSVVQIDSLPKKYNGIYTIMDTGPRVQGRHIDLYIWSCYEALDFGRRLVRLTVLRLGWNPRASSPSLVDTLFRRRERELRQPPPVDARPLQKFDSTLPH